MPLKFVGHVYGGTEMTLVTATHLRDGCFQGFHGRGVLCRAGVNPRVGVNPRFDFVRQVHFCCNAKADKWQGDRFTNVAVDPRQLASEREEAKTMLTSFLKRLGISNTVAIQTVKKSHLFIRHLISMLHSCYHNRYVTGQELTTIEIKSALLPYLKSLATKYGDGLVDILLHFPNTPSREENNGSSVKKSRSTSKKIKILEKQTSYKDDGYLHPSFAYLLTFGLNLEQLKTLRRKFPAIVTYSIEGKIKPTMELLLELGISHSDIHKIILKRPQLFGCSLDENLRPTMAYLESLGVEKKSWAKIIVKFPALLTYSKRKIQHAVNFMLGMGISSSNIGKVLTRFPHIVSYSVEENLRPTAAYFNSMGVDVGILTIRCPQTFGLSIESNIKPVTNFFLDVGFSMDDISTMISRFGSLYTFSLADNLHPKWDFFVHMGRSKSELVQFPQYFGYSLEQRIKPRYKRLEQCTIVMNFNQMLSSSETEFERLLGRELTKMKLDFDGKQQDMHPSMTNLEFRMSKMSLT